METVIKMITISSEITSNLNVGEKRKGVIERSFFSPSSSAIQTVNLNLGEKREIVCSYSSLLPITRLSAALKAVRERRDSCVLTPQPATDERPCFLWISSGQREQIWIK